MRERTRVVQEEEDGYLIPQWLIAVIVIGLASLLFILIFGITVVSVNELIYIYSIEEMSRRKYNFIMQKIWSCWIDLILEVQKQWCRGIFDFPSDSYLLLILFSNSPLHITLIILIAM